MYFGGGIMERNLESIMKVKLSPSRWNHSLGVAETSIQLAQFWKGNPDKARLAGILHDYAREIPEGQLVILAETLGYRLLKEERLNPVVLHAPVGALLVKKELGVEDTEVLSAIARHTVGGEVMSLLDKILFLADMIEPKRDWLGVEKLRKLVYNDINLAMVTAVNGTIEYLQERKQIIHPYTLLTRDSILREMAESSNGLS